MERIPLSGLDEAGVLTVMERAAGHDLDEEERKVAQAIHQETEGNPLSVHGLGVKQVCGGFGAGRSARRGNPVMSFGGLGGVRLA